MKVIMNIESGWIWRDVFMFHYINLGTEIKLDHGKPQAG